MERDPSLLTLGKSAKHQGFTLPKQRLLGQEGGHTFEAVSFTGAKKQDASPHKPPLI